MSTSKRFYRRTFLNKRGHQAGAYVIADVTVETNHIKSRDGRPERFWKSVDGGLTVADCSRVTTLDFSASDYSQGNKEKPGDPSSDIRELKNMLFKARTLQTVVNGFVAALEEAAEELDL